MYDSYSMPIGTMAMPLKSLQLRYIPIYHIHTTYKSQNSNAQWKYFSKTPIGYFFLVLWRVPWQCEYWMVIFYVSNVVYSLWNRKMMKRAFHLAVYTAAWATAPGSCGRKWHVTMLSLTLCRVSNFLRWSQHLCSPFPPSTLFSWCVSPGNTLPLLNCSATPCASHSIHAREYAHSFSMPVEQLILSCIHSYSFYY